MSKSSDSDFDLDRLIEAAIYEAEKSNSNQKHKSYKVITFDEQGKTVYKIFYEQERLKFVNVAEGSLYREEVMLKKVEGLYRGTVHITEFTPNEAAIAIILGYIGNNKDIYLRLALYAAENEDKVDDKILAFDIYTMAIKLTKIAEYENINKYIDTLDSFKIAINDHVAIAYTFYLYSQKNNKYKELADKILSYFDEESRSTLINGQTIYDYLYQRLQNIANGATKQAHKKSGLNYDYANYLDNIAKFLMAIKNKGFDFNGKLESGESFGEASQNLFSDAKIVTNANVIKILKILNGDNLFRTKVTTPMSSKSNFRGN